MDIQNDATFIAPEGVYSLTDDIKSPPFGTTGPPAASPYSQYPTRISSIVVKYAPHKPPSGGASLGSLLGVRDSRRLASETQREPDKTSLSSSDKTDEDQNTSPDPSSTDRDVPSVPALFSPVTSTPVARSKSIRPKHNIKTTSSSFVTRIHTMEGLSKYLSLKQGEVTFLFYNAARSFFWVESGSKAKDPLARITFSAFPSSHSVNTVTASPERLDVLIGFSSGDLIWFDAISARYVRLNKGGTISHSAVTSVQWIPRSDKMFMTAHVDGTIIIFDKEREDPSSFVPKKVVSPLSPQSAILTNPLTTNPIPKSNSDSGTSWNPLFDILVSRPPWHQSPPLTSHHNNHHQSSMSSPAPEKEKREKIGKNPLSHWRVSWRAVLDFTFSPDLRYVAVVSEDGCLRIIDALNESLVDSYASYFGSLTTVAWSPDGRYILTGGQDDLVTIYSPWDQRVIARCQGHSSFISAVAFDELRCDSRTYRFGSVGEDNKLVLWDFSATALHRPKLHAQALQHRHSFYSGHQRTSLGSTVSLVLRKRGETQDMSTLHLPQTSLAGAGEGVLKYHPAPPRSDVAVLQPVLIKQIEPDILSSLLFLPNALLTCSKTGQIKFWVRPLLATPRRLLQEHGSKRRGAEGSVNTSST